MKDRQTPDQDMDPQFGPLFHQPSQKVPQRLRVCPRQAGEADAAVEVPTDDKNGPAGLLEKLCQQPEIARRVDQ